MKYKIGRCPVCGDDGSEVTGAPVGLELYDRVAIYNQDNGDELHSDTGMCYCGNCGAWVPQELVK